MSDADVADGKLKSRLRELLDNGEERKAIREKAKTLASSKGYEPDPQKTLKERKGICFDYASLAAAMLRAVGIPCRVVTGYVDNNYYHSWISAYANGRWHRVDPTSMAVGHKFNEYRNRYVY